MDRQIDRQIERRRENETERKLDRKNIESDRERERQKEKERETQSVNHLSVDQFALPAKHHNNQTLLYRGFLALKFPRRPYAVPLLNMVVTIKL